MVSRCEYPVILCTLLPAFVDSHLWMEYRVSWPNKVGIMLADAGAIKVRPHIQLASNILSSDVQHPLDRKSRCREPVFLSP